MATFTVHVPPGIADPAARADRTAFVRDGFSPRAFLLGPVYLLYHRLWRETLAWFVAAGLLTALARGLALPAPAGLSLYLVLAILTGLEAGRARHRALDRRGYAFAAVLAGVTRPAGERLFFASGEDGSATRSPPAAAMPRPPVGRQGPVIGLFPKPRGRG